MTSALYIKKKSTLTLIPVKPAVLTLRTDDLCSWPRLSWNSQHHRLLHQQTCPLLIRDHTEMKTVCLLCTWLSLVQWPDTSSQILIGHCVSMGSHYQCCDMKYPWPLSAAAVLDVLLAVCTCCKYSLSVESHNIMHNPQRHLNVNSSKCQGHTHTHTH